MVNFAAPEQHYGDSATQASDVFSLCAVIHFALHYDKPELRKPHRFAPSLVPESLREAMTQGMKNTDQRLRDAGQLLKAFVPVATPAKEEQPAEPTAKLTSDEIAVKEEQPIEPAPKLGSGKIGDVIEVPLSSSVKVKFAWVPPGNSWLGGGGGTAGQEKFTLPKGLWCGVYPVTQAEWQAVMGDNPSHFKNKPRHPVESVSWDRVQEFLKALNAKLGNTGLSYRLPTEQEWEYICRGGPLSSPEQSKYHFYFAKSKTDLTAAPTDDLSSRQANFDGNHPFGAASKGPYLQTTTEVGSYLPNPLGIYDLHGNVWEWTSSQEGSGRVIRGGCWLHYGEHCQASYRSWLVPARAGSLLGCRLLAVPVG